MSDTSMKYIYEAEEYYCINGVWYDKHYNAVSAKMSYILSENFPNAIDKSLSSYEELINPKQKSDTLDKKNSCEIYSYEYDGAIYYCINNNWYDGFLNKVNYLKKIDLDEAFPGVREKTTNIQIEKNAKSVVAKDESTGQEKIIDVSKTAIEWISLGDEYFESDMYFDAWQCYWNAIGVKTLNKERIGGLFSKATKCSRKLKNYGDVIFVFCYLMEYQKEEVVDNYWLMTSLAGTLADLFEETSNFKYLKDAFNASDVALLFQDASEDTASEEWKNNRSRLNRLKDLYEKK